MSKFQETVFNRHTKLFSEINQVVSLAGKKVLDFGCGDGAGTTCLSLLGVDIIGIDNDQPGCNSIDEAMKYASQKGGKAIFRLMDGENMDFASESFDVVLAIDVLEHISNLHKILREVYRILKVGGCLVIIWQPYYSPYGGHLRFYSKNPWRQLMPFFNKERFLMKACQRNPVNSYAHELAVQNSLNKLTLRKFKNMIASMQFDLVVLKKRSFEVNSSTMGLGLERMLKIILNKLPMIPFFEEFTTASVLAIVKKR